MKGSIKEKILFYMGVGFLVILLGLLVANILKKGVYSNKMGMNVAVVGEKGISLMLLRPEEQMVSWVDIPNGVKVKIYNSTASYPIESLWSYGESEKDAYNVVKKSLGQSMGIIVAKVIRINKVGQIEDVLGQLLNLGLKTDLSVRDRFLIRQLLSESVKSKKYLELALPNNVFDKVIEPDGKEFLSFNSTMSLWAENKFVLEPILNENADVSVNNISDIEGIGLLLSKQLESSGLHVVEVKAEKSENISGGGCLYWMGKSFPMTEILLHDQVGCRKIDRPTFVEGDDEKVRVWVK